MKRCVLWAFWGCWFVANGWAVSLSLQSQIPAVVVYALDDWRGMLLQQAPALRTDLSDALLVMLKRVRDAGISHNHRLAVIDYSLPSNQKRLWVFDLNTRQLLLHTYVSHGIKSGALLTDHFSNRYNSKASSVGLYRTGQVYYGREGLTLKLHGLDRGFNDNAESRAIVMHGAWYMDEGFIQKYGRAGRSWGCPALPLEMKQPVIDAIKDGALLVMYYPSATWYSASRFLHDEAPLQVPNYPDVHENLAPVDDARGAILWASHEAVLVIPASEYEHYFHAHPPLERMLRRQINQMEYIALTPTELDQAMVASEASPGLLDVLYLVQPSLKMAHGYYQTEMKIMPVGKLKAIDRPPPPQTHYTVHAENNTTITLRPVTYFIRWLGL